MAILSYKTNNKIISLLKNKAISQANATVLKKHEVEKLLTEYFSKSIASLEQKHIKSHGEFSSIFRGGGHEFEELRAYQPGDDIRTIDWRTTAKLNKLYIRTNRKEQNSSVFVFLDYSNSMHFGTRVRLKSTQAARLTLLLFAKYLKKEVDITIAIYNGTATEYHSKKVNAKNISDLISIINKPTSKNESLEKHENFNQSLESIAALSKNFENVYILSDFKNFSKSTLPPLASLSNSGYIKLLKVSDPIEFKLPKMGKINFYDTSINKYLNIDTSSSKVRKELSKNWNDIYNIHKEIAKEIGLKFNDCLTTDDTLKVFIRAGMNL